MIIFCLVKLENQSLRTAWQSTIFYSLTLTLKLVFSEIHQPQSNLLIFLKPSKGKPFVMTSSFCFPNSIFFNLNRIGLQMWMKPMILHCIKLWLRSCSTRLHSCQSQCTDVLFPDCNLEKLKWFLSFNQLTLHCFDQSLYSASTQTTKPVSLHK